LILHPAPKYDVSECEPPEGGVCDNCHTTRKIGSYIPSYDLQAGAKDKADGEGCSELKKREGSESYDTTYIRSPGNSALRKQMSTTNTRIYDFTGDINGDR